MFTMTEAAPEIDQMAEAAGRFGINADAVASAAFLGGDAWAEQEAILSRALTDARETHGVYSDEYKTIQGIVATAQEWVDAAVPCSRRSFGFG